MNEKCFYNDNKNVDEFRDFDLVVGHIEDLLVNSNFQCMLFDFMEKHWMVFEDVEENKFIYTDIFSEYTKLVENYINRSLIEKNPSFSMQNFLGDLEKHKQGLDGEVFEILFSLSDFLTFKEAILDFRKMKEGQFVSLESNLSIVSLTNKQ